MGNPINQRQHPRFPVADRNQRFLFSKNRFSNLKADFIDVSVQGLGLIIYEPLSKDPVYVLVSGRHTIDIQLIWSKPMDGTSTRCGFKSVIPTIDLIPIVSQSLRGGRAIIAP